MPCRDYSDSELNHELQEKLNKVTAMLCAVCTRLEKLGKQNSVAVVEVVALIKANRALNVWWEAHKKADRVRIATEREAIREKRKQLEAELRKLDAMEAADEHEDQYREPEEGDPIYSPEASSTISALEDGFYAVIGFDFNSEIALLVWSREHQAWTDKKFEEYTAEAVVDDDDDDEETVKPKVGDTFWMRHSHPNTKGTDGLLKIVRVTPTHIRVRVKRGGNQTEIPQKGLIFDYENEYFLNPTYEASLRKARK